MVYRLNNSSVNYSSIYPVLGNSWAFCSWLNTCLNPRHILFKNAKIFLMENPGRNKQTTCEVKMTETLGQNQGNWASVSVYGGGIQVIQVWEIQPSWVNVTLMDPGSWKWHKMTFLLHYFQNIVRKQKIKDLTESKNVCAEVFQITIKQKNWGARCTLNYC